MTDKIKWNYISEAERQEAYDDLKLFWEARESTGKKNREILERLFSYYNDYVSFKYPRVGSSMSCGKCVKVVLQFFTSELQKYRDKQS
tara:strand:+ start:592 stop:855 length:264 start_codon:yes stop_codon:yes gene_type:complete